MSEYHGGRLDRRKVVARILKDRRDALLITGLGGTTWDAAAAGDDRNNFYLWGAMGGAALVGLGLALAQPRRRALVLTGDGELLMGLGGLATIAVQRPPNLCVIVIDNQCYGETGMQHTHTYHGVDLPAIATAVGFPASRMVRTESELEETIPVLYGQPGPVFASIEVQAATAPTVLPPRDGPYLRDRFRHAVLGYRKHQS